MPSARMRLRAASSRNTLIKAWTAASTAPKTCAPTPCESGVRRGVTDARLQGRKNRIERGQPRDALDGGIRSHRNYDKGFVCFYESRPNDRKDA